MGKVSRPASVAAAGWGVTLDLSVAVMSGQLVRLEPLSVRHAAGLAVAAEEDRATYGWTEVPRAHVMADYVTDHLRAFQDKQRVPLAQVRVRDGRPVGATCFGNPRPWPKQDELCAVEIGWTWLAAWWVTSCRGGTLTRCRPHDLVTR